MKPRRIRSLGAVAVEFAIVLVMLLTLVFAAIEFGRAILAYNTIANAAREGARTGIVDFAGADAAARSLIVGVSCDPLEIDPQRGETTVSVKVDCTFKTVIGNLIPALADVSLISTATMQREQ